MAAALLKQASTTASGSSTPNGRRSILAESLDDYHYEGMLRLAAIDGRLHLDKEFDDQYEWTNTEAGRGIGGIVRVAERVGGRTFEGEINPMRCVKSHRKRSQVGRDPEEIEAELQRECSIYLSVDHPNIARLIDVYEDEFNITMVMEYCLGGTLEARIHDQGHIVERRAQGWLSQLLLGVAHMHHKEICHRDIKPLNIVFSDSSEEATLKLIDFDASVTCPDLDTGDMLRGPAGTRAYMAPEMFTSVEDLGFWYDQKCDLWSTGVTLFKMLSGKEPFVAPNIPLAFLDDSDGGGADFLEEDWCKSIRAGKYSFDDAIWSTVSDQGRDLVRQLLSLDPEQRPDAMEAMRHIWLSSKQEERVKVSFAMESFGSDVLNALVCFCEVSDDLRYSLLKLCYSKVDIEMQRITPIFGLFDRKYVGCIDLEDFATTLQGLGAAITAPQCEHLFDRLINCFHEKEASTKQKTLQYSEFMAAVLPIITMPGFVSTVTDGHGIGLSVLDIESDLRTAFNLERTVVAVEAVSQPGKTNDFGPATDRVLGA